MAVNITFRKIRATEPLNNYVETKVGKLSKLINYPMDIHVLLSLEKTYQTAEISCHAEHRQLFAMAKSKNLYESIDLVVKKIESQLKKERERKKGHKSGHSLARQTTKLAIDLEAQVPHREKHSR